MANQVVGAVKGIARVFWETYKLGFRAWWAAPLIVAIAVVPEFLQHIVEIKLGMFQSMERFQALSQNPTRWAFGYAKLTGTMVSILAIARFWAVGSVRRTLLIPPSDLLRLVMAIAVTWAVSLPFDWLATRHWPMSVVIVVKVASALIQAGLAVFVVAALLGDRSVTLRTAFSERWPTALVLACAVLVAFLPAQLLHMFNHKVAIGKPAVIVWALMGWDALVVGLIATLTGSALWVAYRSGATWRGWGAGFMPPAEPGAQTEVSEPTIEPEPVAAVANAQPVAEPGPVVDAARRERRRPGPRPRR